MVTTKTYLQDLASFNYGWSKNQCNYLRTFYKKRVPYQSVQEAAEYLQKEDFRELLYISPGLNSSEVELLVVDIDWSNEFDFCTLSEKKMIIEMNVYNRGIPIPTYIVWNNEKASCHLIWQLDKPFKFADLSFNGKYINKNIHKSLFEKQLAIQYMLCRLFDGDLSFYKDKSKVRNPWYTKSNNVMLFDSNISISNNNIIYNFNSLYNNIYSFYLLYYFNENNTFENNSHSLYKIIEDIENIYKEKSESGILIKINNKNNNLEYLHKNDLIVYEGLRIIREYKLENITVDILFLEIRKLLDVYIVNNNKKDISDKLLKSKCKGVIKMASKTYNETASSLNSTNRTQELGKLKQKMKAISKIYKVQKMYNHIYSIKENKKYDQYGVKQLARDLKIDYKSARDYLKVDLHSKIDDFTTKFASLFDKCMLPKISEILTNWESDIDDFVCPVDLIEDTYNKILNNKVEEKKSVIRAFDKSQSYPYIRVDLTNIQLNKIASIVTNILKE